MRVDFVYARSDCVALRATKYGLSNLRENIWKALART